MSPGFNLYSLFAVVFVFSTCVMVTGVFILGYLHMKEERDEAVPAPAVASKDPPEASPPIAANDAGKLRKAS